MCGGESNPENVEEFEAFNNKSMLPIESFDKDLINKFNQTIQTYVIDPSLSRGEQPTALMTSAWQLSGCVLIELLRKHFPELKLLLLNVDTLHGFPETNQIQEEMTKKYQLDVRVYTPLNCSNKEEFTVKYGS